MTYDFQTEFASALGDELQPLDHLECLPDSVFDIGGRFRNHPTFSPVSFDVAQRVQKLDWTNASLVSIPPKNYVTQNRVQLTFSARSVKTNSVQSGESPWEYFLCKELEADPKVSCFQMHGVRLHMETADGPISYEPDAVWQETSGKLVVGEVKASDSYFDHPDEAPMFNRVSDILAGFDVEFRKFSMDRERRRARRAWNISRIYMDRATSVPPQEMACIEREIMKAGGAIQRGDLKAAMRSPEPVKERVLNAMLCRSLLSFDINSAITENSLVTFRKMPGRKIDLQKIKLT